MYVVQHVGEIYILNIEVECSFKIKICIFTIIQLCDLPNNVCVIEYAILLASFMCKKYSQTAYTP